MSSFYVLLTASPFPHKDINARNSKGMTALHLSLCHKHEVIALLLISTGADLALRDPSGASPLHIAAVSELYKVLLPVATATPPVCSGAVVVSCCCPFHFLLIFCAPWRHELSSLSCRR